MQRDVFFRYWAMAIRPRTLPAAVSPVVLGSSLAASEGAFHALAAFCALLAAVAIQVGTNLANDYWDARQGADSAERLGPIRVTAAGLLPARQVLVATGIAFAIAVIAGGYLVLRGGLPILLIGLASIACGILYTAGRKSIAYLGLGDIFAFLFFGIIAVAGTYFVQVLRVSPQALLLGVLPGCYSVVLIAINNLRDAPGDRKAGKRTLAVRFGERFARGEIVAFALLPVCLPAVWQGMELGIGWVLAGIAFFLALPVVVSILRQEKGAALNRLLGKTSFANLGMAILWSAVLLW